MACIASILTSAEKAKYSVIKITCFKDAWGLIPPPPPQHHHQVKIFL